MGDVYSNKDATMQVEIIGERLCFDIAGKDDYEIFKNPEGNTEFAFSTPLENMELIAIKILKRVKEVREYRQADTTRRRLR